MVNDLIDHGVDLILHGHDHNFQRSHQLRCIERGTTAAGCIVDADSRFRAEAGSVIVLSGWVARDGYDVHTSDSEAGYFAVLAGPNRSGWNRGYLRVTATENSLSGSYVSPYGGNTDTFTIER